MRLKKGDNAPIFKVSDIFGNVIDLEAYRGKKILLSFYRYASCPFCNFRIHNLVEEHSKLREKGLYIIAFFQSPKKNLVKYMDKQNTPFPIIPDPFKTEYKKYGVEKSFWGFLKSGLRVKDFCKALNKGFLPAKPDGDYTTVPADFLINPDLTINTAYYGKDIGDHIPIDEIFNFL